MPNVLNREMIKKYTTRQLLFVVSFGFIFLILGILGMLMAFVGWQDIDGPTVSLSQFEKIISGTGEMILTLLFGPVNLLPDYIHITGWVLGFLYGFIIVLFYKVIKKV
jgi:hypothetical protein